MTYNTLVQTINELKGFCDLREKIYEDRSFASDPKKHEELRKRYFDINYTSGFVSFMARDILNIGMLSIQGFYDKLEQKYPDIEQVKKGKELIIDNLTFLATH